ncbi:hypothetical protein BJY01DRAFT_201399 [Aspergillus pseudoustus]|uniref:SRR1-like domain-containing protein n=1 Tax=Aspergillus pseudoustus TaxID=1810923 RepID=A0ABR4L256_9EURO
MQLSIIGPSHCIDKPKDTGPPPSPAVARSQIDDWLSAGKPFFSRRAIQAINEQLRAPRTNENMIFVKALDDATIAFEVAGQRGPIGKPCIQYISYESLRAGKILGSGHPHLIYCPMIIQHAVTATTPLLSGDIPPGIPRRSIDDIHRVFKTALHIWEESDTWRQLKATFLTIRTLPNIRKIIAFACGTMSFADEVPGSSYNAIFQHAFLVSLQRLLQKQKDTSDQQRITCSVQDPAYTDGDRVVLATYGISILDDPEGFLVVNDESLVFSCAPDIPVKQIIVDIASLAIIIWDRVGDGSDSGEADPDSPRVRQVMARFYDTFQFPQEEHFGDMAIYVRRHEID